jgi:hypothetical protein
LDIIPNLEGAGRMKQGLKAVKNPPGSIDKPRISLRYPGIINAFDRDREGQKNFLEGVNF